MKIITINIKKIIVIDNNWEINLFSLNHKIILNKVSVARAPTKK